MPHPPWNSFVYLYRVGVPPNETEESLRAGSESGNFLKECMLAQLLYDSGDNVGALKHYTHASRGGSSAALYNAGVMTDLGLGTEKSTKDAIVMYKRAMSTGSIDAAMHRLGYHTGLIGGEEEGVVFIYKAAQGGLVEAMYDWGMMHLFNFGLVEGREDQDAYGSRWLNRALEMCKLNERKVALATEIAFQLSLYHYGTRSKTNPIPPMEVSFRFAEYSAGGRESSSILSIIRNLTFVACFPL